MDQAADTELDRLTAEAKSLFNERKFDRAFPAVLAADQEDPDILYALGYMHYFGHGTKCDRKKGIDFVRRADARGCKYADRVLLWMIFHAREILFGTVFSVLCALAGGIISIRYGSMHPAPLVMRFLCTAAAIGFAAYDLFAIFFAAVNRYFAYMTERLGMLLFSLAGIVVGGAVSSFVFFLILLFFVTQTQQNRDMIVASGMLFLITGAVIGFRIGRSCGSCIGESTAQALSAKE